VIILSCLIVIVLYLSSLLSSSVYFFHQKYYFISLIMLLFLNYFIKDKKIKDFIELLIILILSYSCIEICYKLLFYYKIKLELMDYYSLQYVALVFLSFFIKSKYLCVGNLGKKCCVNNISWLNLGIEIILMTLLINFLILYSKMETINLNINIIYYLNIALIEELLFRNFILSYLSDKYGDKYGNIIQSLLFGLIHYSCFSSVYLLNIIILSFLGWLFGKSTQETGGIFISWMIHSFILLILGTSILF